jgi:uncharacterized membrane protein YcaP (DUF421 family)
VLGPAGLRRIPSEEARRLRRTAGMFFTSWAAIGRVALVTTTVFVAIVAMLRLVGQQALAKMSGFELVFTVTLGSVVANVAVSRDITVSEAVAALLTMLALQEVLRFLQSRYLPVHHLVREPPRVLLWDGELLEDRLRETSVSADEIRAAVRKAGLRSLNDAQAVVLENDGDWSVIPKGDGRSDESAFFGLPIPGRPGSSPGDHGDRAEPTSNRRIP